MKYQSIVVVSMIHSDCFCNLFVFSDIFATLLWRARSSETIHWNRSFFQTISGNGKIRGEIQDSYSIVNIEFNSKLASKAESLASITAGDCLFEQLVGLLKVCF